MAESYAYRARDRSGEIVAGELLADSPGAVAAHIRNQGMLVLKIEQAGTKNKDIREYLRKSRTVPMRDLVVFCRQFSTMVSAGLPLVNALSILIEQTLNSVLKKALQDVYKKVQEGMALSAALAKHPHIFPKIMIHLVESGELGGVLDEVLGQLAMQLEKDYKLNQKVKSALVYPAVVMGFALVVVTGILIFIIPVFTDMYMQIGAVLPLPTRILLAVSEFLRNFGLYLLLALALAALAFKRHSNIPSLKAFMDAIVLKLPVFGLLFRKVAIARFSRTMGTMIQGGVPIVQALDVVKNTANVKQMVIALTDAQDSMREGFSFASPLSRSGLFPPMVVQMVAIGEATGQLDEMLRKVAEFYESDVDDMVARLSGLLEPFLIIFMGVVLGSIIVSILFPLFDIVTKIH